MCLKRTKKNGRPPAARFCLAPESETLDERLVTIVIVGPQVFQQTTTATDHLEKTTTAVVIFLVGFEVTVEVVDALGEEGSRGGREVDEG